MNEAELDSVRKSVREHYGKIAAGGNECGCTSTCCGGKPGETSEKSYDIAATSQTLGYSAEETGAAPEGANLGLGCGNPVALASLRPGQTVLDLGSGAGFDAFLAARAVGPTGHVIGVDMTPEMVTKARQNKAKGDYGNIEFRLGEIESLPVADNSVDVILSNCVINLSPDKARVFREAFRVLKSGGRLAISDIVATAPMPESLREDLELYAGCVAGTVLVEDVKAMLLDAGFAEVRVEPKPESRQAIRDWFPGHGLENYVVSATIEAIKR
ncbi:MAG: arsenite methyltransferase [Solirubrobacterales bacterium]